MAAVKKPAAPENTPQVSPEAPEDPNHTRVKNLRGADKNTLPPTGTVMRETEVGRGTVRRDY